MRDPPAAESGRVYGSVEERCRACEVNGGDESPCISDERIRWWQEHHGRPCPRVELDERNAEPMVLLGWLIHDDLEPLVPEYARALLAGRPASERETILARVGRAMRSKELMARLHPSAEGDRG